VFAWFIYLLEKVPPYCLRSIVWFDNCLLFYVKVHLQYINLVNHVLEVSYVQCNIKSPFKHNCWVAVSNLVLRFLDWSKVILLTSLLLSICVPFAFLHLFLVCVSKWFMPSHNANGSEHWFNKPLCYEVPQSAAVSINHTSSNSCNAAKGVRLTRYQCFSSASPPIHFLDNKFPAQRTSHHKEHKTPLHIVLLFLRPTITTTKYTSPVTGACSLSTLQITPKSTRQNLTCHLRSCSPSTLQLQHKVHDKTSPVTGALVH
jgi:hypothetical protein